MVQNIHVYNSLTGAKEPFIPIENGKVGMYCCGPTTYNYIHIGNARPLVVFDSIRRYLIYLGYDVTFVSNFTDVDDKIIDRAAVEGEEPKALADRYIAEFFPDADALGNMRADAYPKVSEHMPEIIAFVDALIDKGKAYEIDGDVYYSVAAFGSYGKLSKRSREDLLDGARVDVDQRKRDPADFALWKSSKPGEPAWDSPWGKGRPGWHIECSAMSHKYLGESFDIHGGGADLIFPHHENEIAQSEGRFGREMAKYWMHNGFITVNREKMSKSLGNFFLVREILEQFDGQVMRFYLLSAHYKSPLDFDDEKLTMAQRSLERLKNSVRAALAVVEAAASKPESTSVSADSESVIAFKDEIDKAKAAFMAAMSDDFNTALAIAALFDMARAINTYIASENQSVQALGQAAGQLTELSGVLGIELPDGSDSLGEDDTLLAPLGKLADELGIIPLDGWSVEAIMDALITLRQRFRSEKDYAGADRIRDELKALGLMIEDTTQGVRWRRV